MTRARCSISARAETSPPPAITTATEPPMLRSTVPTPGSGRSGASPGSISVNSDLPVPGDYDGDGCTDAGIFRRSTGLWAIRSVSRTYFGGLLDIPIPGIYDSSYQARIGIFRPASGLWVIRDVTRRYSGLRETTQSPPITAATGSRRSASSGANPVSGPSTGGPGCTSAPGMISRSRQTMPGKDSTGSPSTARRPVSGRSAV